MRWQRFKRFLVSVICWKLFVSAASQSLKFFFETFQVRGYVDVLNVPQRVLNQKHHKVFGLFVERGFSQCLSQLFSHSINLKGNCVVSLVA